MEESTNLSDPIWKCLTIFDNLDDTLKSPYLAQAVTSEIWTDRILGITEDALLHQRTVFIVSGNNIALGGDLPRRCYWIRMDANMPRPWLGRSFRHADLKGWVSDNRGRLLAALLTMAAHGMPRASRRRALRSLADSSDGAGCRGNTLLCRCGRILGEPIGDV